MDIQIESGNLVLIRSGWFQTAASEDIRLNIGGLVIVFRFVQPVEGEKPKPPTLRSDVDVQKLQLTQIVEGDVPVGPASLLSTRPQRVGTVSGVPVYLSWKVQRVGRGNPQVELWYSVYKEQPAVAKKT